VNEQGKPVIGAMGSDVIQGGKGKALPERVALYADPSGLSPLFLRLGDGRAQTCPAIIH
jgi:hypothetical protein